MKAQYIIRLDDACPTMSQNWDRMEKLLDDYRIMPLVAVIPDNVDSELTQRPADPAFWDRVRGWQEKGWDIAMHGYQHQYVTHNGGLIPLNQKSEFAGLELSIQQEKIKKGWQIFMDKKISVDTWIAPAHSFDANTLEAIRKETSITTISDGIALSPFYSDGFTWIPQQFWKFKKLPFGVFTICLHPNTMKEQDFFDLEQAFITYRKNFVTSQSLKHSRRKKSMLDASFATLWWKLYGYKK